MRRLTRVARQLMPSALWIITYWAVSLGLLLVIATGLRTTGEQSGSLWGLKLVRFGYTSDQILSNAFVEMMRHVWTVVALPFTCFVGLKPLCRSFRSDFTQFLRYSRSSRLLVEGGRLAAFLFTVLAVSLPFAAASLCGHLYLGLTWETVVTGGASCAAATLFVSVMVYLLASFGTPTEIAIGIGMPVPFFLTGLSELFAKGGHVFLDTHFPIGLPYSVDSYTDMNLRVTVVLAVVALAGRLVAAVRTRWLTTPRGSRSGGDHIVPT